MIEDSKDGYPELEEKKNFIFKVLSQEEEKFNKTIDQGLSILSRSGSCHEARKERPLSMEKTRSISTIPTASRWI